MEHINIYLIDYLSSSSQAVHDWIDYLGKEGNYSLPIFVNKEVEEQKMKSWGGSMRTAGSFLMLTACWPLRRFDGHTVNYCFLGVNPGFWIMIPGRDMCVGCHLSHDFQVSLDETTSCLMWNILWSCKGSTGNSHSWWSPRAETACYHVGIWWNTVPTSQRLVSELVWF